MDQRSSGGQVRGPATSAHRTKGSPQLSRRSLLKKGAVGGAILLMGGGLATFFRGGRRGPGPRAALRVLSEREYDIFTAVAARVCPHGPQAAGWPSVEALDCAGKVDVLMAGLHPQGAAEFRKLLHVFENGLTGLFSVGQPATFTASSPEDQDRRLDSWRRSRLPLFRSGYQAMKRLAHATYYAAPLTYAGVGYPGPPVVPQIPT